MKSAKILSALAVSALLTVSPLTIAVVAGFAGLLVAAGTGSFSNAPTTATTSGTSS